MKITLTELRQMVRNIISEMDGNMDSNDDKPLELPYKLWSSKPSELLPYQVWSGAGDEEDYGNGYNYDRLKEVKELTERALNYNIIGTMPYKNEYQAEKIKGNEIDSGVFSEKINKKRETKYVDRNDKSKYEYSIYAEEGNDVHAIVVNYHEINHKFDKNDYYKGYDEYDEEFIFYGYPN